MAATIRRFVECESPSDDAAAVSRFMELVADTVAPYARVKTYPGGKFGRLMVAEMQLPGAARTARYWRWDIPIRYGRWGRCAACRSARRTAGCGDRACWI